jgi:hypothetical protein
MNRTALHTLEGQQVNVSLRGGARIDDCQLVSAGRAATPTIWLFANGTDVFVPVADVVDVHEVRATGRAA